jgi:hypothetical protein
LKITTPTNATEYQMALAGFSTGAPVVPGFIYKFIATLNVLSITETREIFAIVKFYNAKGERVGSEHFTNFVNSPGEHTLELAATAPAEAATAEVTAFYINGKGKAEFYIDAIYFGEGNSYFDGGYPQAEWTGTLGDSISEMRALVNSTIHGFTAVLSFAGALRRSILHNAEATLGLTTSSQRNVLHRLDGVLSTLGSIVPKKVSKFVKKLTATLQFAGVLEGHAPLRIVSPVLLRFAYGPDQLTHHLDAATLTLITQSVIPDGFVLTEPDPYITERSPNNFEEDLVSPKATIHDVFGATRTEVKSSLPDITSTLVKMRNQTALVTYDKEHNPIEVSESYS